MLGVLTQPHTPKGIDMKRQDHSKKTTSNDTKNVNQLRQIVQKLFPVAIFNNIEQKSHVTWTPVLLVTCAFLWMAHTEKNLTDAFHFARKILFNIFPITTLGTSYQGFMDQLGRYNERLKSVILPHFRKLTKLQLKNHWFVAGFILLGVDGSRFQLARTQSLQAAYAPKKKKKETKRKYKKRVQRYKTKQAEKARQKKSESPQLWLTLLWHVGTGLPYNWRIGPSDSSEREHAQSMFKELARKALIVADAGFIGYDFWLSMLEAKVDFLVRVGGNVTLLRELGYSCKERGDTVYLWPKDKQKTHPPLVLRLIRVHDGRSPLFLVTNLESEKLSDEAAVEVYRRRWGIEVFFRTLKQTFDRRKLRSKSEANVPLELEWSLIALWGMSLIGEECVQKSGIDIAHTSPAKVLKAFATAIREYRVPLEEGEQALLETLRTAIQDNYVRTSSKTSREYPKKTEKKKLHEPRIITATMDTKIKAKIRKNAQMIT
jgi:hypothetical protein